MSPPVSAPAPAPQSVTQTGRNRKGGSGWAKIMAIVVVVLVVFMVFVPAKAEREIPLLPPPAGFDPGDPVTDPAPQPQPPEAIVTETPTTMTQTVTPPASPASAVAELIGPDGSVVVSAKIFSITRDDVEKLRVTVDFTVPETTKKYVVITVTVAFAPKMWALNGSEPDNVWEDGMVLVDGEPARYCITVYCPGATYQPGTPMTWIYKNALYGVYARYWAEAGAGAKITKTFEFSIANALERLDPYMIGYVTVYVGVNVKVINSEVEMRYQSSTVAGGETAFLVDVVDGRVVWVE